VSPALSSSEGSASTVDESGRAYMRVPFYQQSADSMLVQQHMAAFYAAHFGICGHV
jgi:hypothetical protein